MALPFRASADSAVPSVFSGAAHALSSVWSLVTDPLADAMTPWFMQSASVAPAMPNSSSGTSAEAAPALSHAPTNGSSAGTNTVFLTKGSSELDILKKDNASLAARVAALEKIALVGRSSSNAAASSSYVSEAELHAYLAGLRSSMQPTSSVGGSYSSDSSYSVPSPDIAGKSFVNDAIGSVQSSLGSQIGTLSAVQASTTSSQWTNVTAGLAYAGGNVGIGTTTPEAALDVAGTARFGSITTGEQSVSGDFAVTGLTNLATTTITGILTVIGNTQITSGGQLTVGDKIIAPGEIGLGTSTPSGKLAVQSTNPLQPSFLLYGTSTQSAPLVDIFDSPASNQSLFRITADGKVGIGSSTPGSLLSIGTANGINFNAGSDATSTFGGNLSVNGNLNFNGTFLENNVPFVGSQWTTNGSKLYYTSGNVGIGSGMTDPPEALSVNGKVWATNVQATNQFYSNSDSSSSPGYASSFDSTSGMFFPANSVLAFSTAGNERLRIDSSGNVGVGTTTPEMKLDVNGGIGANSASSILTSAGDGSTILTLGNLGGSFTIQGHQGSAHFSSGVYAGGLLTAANGSIYFGWDGVIGTDRARLTAGPQGDSQRLMQQNGTYAQRFEVYDSFTDTSNYSHGYFDAGKTTAGALTIGVQGAGTGSSTLSKIALMGGNVGIGTTNPLQKLSVNGNVALIGNNSDYRFDIGSPDSSNIYFTYDTAFNGGNDQFLSISPSVMFMRDANAEFLTASGRFRTGNVAFFQPASGVAGFQDYSQNGVPVELKSVTSLGTPSASSGRLGFITDHFALSGGLTVDGNVGIGTTTLSSKLTVDGNVSATGFYTSNLSVVDEPFWNNSTHAQLGIKLTSDSSYANVRMGSLRTDSIFLGTPNGGTDIGSDGSMFRALALGVTSGDSTNGDGYFFHSDSAGSLFLNNAANNATTTNLRGIRLSTLIADTSVGIGTTTPTLGPLVMASGAYVTTGGVWTNASDRNKKENFTQLDGADILSKIAQLPVTEWNYKNEATSVTHIGPMAQDFYALFKLGGSDTSISTIDPAGIALIGIQAIDQNLNTIASTAATTTAASVSFASSFFASVYEHVSGWLGTATNGIHDLFVGTSHQKTVCVGDPGNETCITKAQLDALLQRA